MAQLRLREAYAGVTVGRMHADEAADLFAVRKTIETITVKRCARRFRSTPHHPEVASFRERIEDLVETGCGALGRIEDLPPLNTEFHLSLAEFSDNPSMLSLLRQVSSKIEWLYAMDVDVRGEHSWAEHHGVGRSSRLMREHIDNSLEGYLLRHASRKTVVE